MNGIGGNCVFVSYLKSMYLTILPFRDHFLHKCHYGEELLYWMRPVLILRFVLMFSKTFLNCNHLKIKAYQDCRDCFAFLNSVITLFRRVLYLFQ